MLPTVTVPRDVQDDVFARVHAALQWDRIEAAEAYAYSPEVLAAYHQSDRARPSDPMWALQVLVHAEQRGAAGQCGFVRRTIAAPALRNKACDFYTDFGLPPGCGGAVRYLRGDVEVFRWPVEGGAPYLGPPVPNCVPGCRVDLVGAPAGTQVTVGELFLSAGDSRAMANYAPSSLHLADRSGVIWTFPNDDPAAE